MTLSTTKARYKQISEPAIIADLPGLISAIQDRLIEEPGDEFGYQVKAVTMDNPSPSEAEDCVEAIDSLPHGENPENYVYLLSVDLMSGPSFTWDLRNGEIPKTGGYGTVAHKPIPLAPGRNYFQQFVQQGECEALIGNGWAGYYYSDARCQSSLKEIKKFLPDWSVRLVRKRYQGVPQTLIAVFANKKASEIVFEVCFVGQGKIRFMPEKVRDMEKGYQFFNVMDTHHDRIRPGCKKPDGTVWQYSY